ncbi:O-methyltransferase family 3 protein [Auriculariales sp. MPI-PUGE-AT-0066]|nr:O-methyltransferase family 3 protein [Auriculariales sp. MPI-PUGE-AT-0066]
MSKPANTNTSPKVWAANDVYHNSFLLQDDAVLDTVRAASAAGGLPEIAVSMAQGKFLNLLVRSHKWRRILEVGTLGGYSAIWLARGLPPDGELITLELSERHATVARENIERAGLTAKVKVIVGNAAETLKTLTDNASFDFAFVDADKENNAIYVEHAKRLVRSGGVIIIDNVVRNGQLADETNTESRVEGCRNLLRSMKEDQELEGTTIATVGEKGYDGFLYALRK